MSIPSVGTVTAMSSATITGGSGQLPRVTLSRRLARAAHQALRFKKFYYDGHVSRHGDTRVLGLLYEATTVMLTRTSADSGLRS